MTAPCASSIVFLNECSRTTAVDRREVAVSRTNNRKRQKGRISDSFGAIWVWTYESPFAEPIAAAGTVIGSALISVSGGQWDRWPLMVLGAVIIVIGLLPSWAQSVTANRGVRRDALLDARADVADAYVRRVLADASEFIGMARAQRVEHAMQEITTAVMDISSRFYSGSDSVRVTYYVISDDGTKLEPAVTHGRQGGAHPFDASADAHGQLGLHQLDIVDLFDFHDYADDLPDVGGSNDRGYVSLISIPVRVGSQGYGLISVESSVEGELDERDGESLAVYASALGFYLAAAERGRHGRNIGGGSNG